jgi:hypothetical protein
LKDELGLSAIRLEIIKTGRRIWLTAYVSPEPAAFALSDYSAKIESIKTAASKVYDNTSTLVVLEPVE